MGDPDRPEDEPALAGTEDDDGDVIPETNVISQNGFDLDAIAAINMREPQTYTSVAAGYWAAYR